MKLAIGRIGITLLVAVVAPAAAQATCYVRDGAEELHLVANGGGLFMADRFTGEDCRLLLHGDGRWIPLREERPRPWGPALYRPVRSLVPGVVYQLVSVNDESGARVRIGRVVAGAAADRTPPSWRGAPRVVWTQYISGDRIDEARMELALPVQDESPLRVTVAVSPVGGEPQIATTVQPEREAAIMSWPMGEGAYLEPGTDYVARVCAEDAAGNRSCAYWPLLFTTPAPEPLPEIKPEPDLVQPLEPAPVAAPPQMERAEVPGRRVDWRCASAGAAGALLVLLIGALVATRRAARRRISRAA